MKTDPVQAEADMSDKADKINTAIENAEAKMERDFLAACARGDANAFASFAPMVGDYSQGVAEVRANQPKRMPTVSEVMVESMEYVRGPSITLAMQVIINASLGVDTKAQAAKLLGEMAKVFAYQNTDTVSALEGL